MSTLIPLSELPLNRKAKVAFIKSNINTKRRMLDLGLVKKHHSRGTVFKPIQGSKSLLFPRHGYRITVRRSL